MAATVPTCEPKSFTAGDSLEFTVSPPDYPPSEGWVASYALKLPTSNTPLVVTDDGAGTFTVTLAAATLADITVETEAELVGTVAGSGEFDGERHVIYRGFVTVLPNPMKGTLADARTTAQIELDALNAAILALTTGKITSYSIGGRAVQYNDLPDMYARQAILEAKVRSEQGRGFRKRVVAFVPVSV